jgi:hypothetical protein
LTLLCVRDVETVDATHTVKRFLTTLDGTDVKRFDEVAIQLSGASGLRCHELLDPVSNGTLPPGRYEMSVQAESDDQVAEPSTTELTVEPAPPDE